METEIIKGTIQHITFHNAENGYTILKLVPDEEHHALNANGTLTVAGIVTEELNVGDRAAFDGYFDEHPKFGPQLKFGGMKKLKQQAKTTIQPMPSIRSNPAASASDSGKSVLRASVERITYYNPENSWGVLKVKPHDKKGYPSEAITVDGTIAVVGVMPELVQGESAQFTGKWVKNEQYGVQFKAEQVIPIAPENKQGIISYISDTVFGIGDVTATRIYDHFGDKTLEILDAAPERIREVGIKSKLEENFIAQWKENRGVRQIMIHLQSYGITSKMSKRIYDQFKMDTLQVVKNDPYKLADDVHGIGFRKADQIAFGIGIQANAPARLQAGLVYALSEMAMEGHTYAPREVLIEHAGNLLEVANSAIDIEQAINENILAERLRNEKLIYQGSEIDAIYTPLYHGSERNAATRLRNLAKSNSKISESMKSQKWDKFLADLARLNNVSLSPEQQGAVKAALTSKVSVLTGGPGTGKTTTLQMVINALDAESFKFLLASPTGRAAKRLSEATGEPASTIHRLLGWNPEGGGFTKNEDEPLECDMLIIDEASMIDILLFNSLLKAIPNEAHLMLVGDVDQLPSVGAGNVLNDVIASEIGHVTRLSQIFRQDDASHIITNAHRINHGKMPFTDNNSSDFFFFSIEDPVEAAAMVVDVVINRLGKKLGEYDPINDVQVIAPMYRGAIGVNALNEALQETLNPGSFRTAEIRIGGKVFRRGDKVMQTKNNYEKEIFNGDIGIVRGIYMDDNSLEVTIDGRDIIYKYDEAEEQLIHAYCISTHRSQGSEYPVVVMPVMPQHYMMLQRNLLYTAITRARKMVILVGTNKAIAMAVNNNKVAERYSGLFIRLKA
jgi:exodeoxyribonuclease V alpha subunit